MNDDFKAGFEHAQKLFNWIIQWHREQGETDLRSVRNSIGGLAPETTIEALKEEYGEDS